MKKQLDYLEEYYGERLSAGGSWDKQLGWESQNAHYERFRVLTREINVSGRRILDVGSGLGDLWQHLSEHGDRCDYTGIDILPAMVTKARARFPDQKFICGDLFADPLVAEGPFDLVYSAGIFNLVATSGPEFLKMAFDTFIGLAREYVAISLLNIASPNRESMYCYFDPAKLKGFLRRPGWELRTVENYLQNDFTLIAKRISND